MEYIGFSVVESSVAIGDKEYTLRNCTPTMSEADRDSLKKHINDKLYTIFSNFQDSNSNAVML